MIPRNVAIDNNRTFLKPPQIESNFAALQFDMTDGQKQGEIEKQLSTLSNCSYYDAYQAFLISLPTRWDMIGLAKAKLDYSKTNSQQTPNTVLLILSLSKMERDQLRHIWKTIL
jgi:hypothetical protein